MWRTTLALALVAGCGGDGGDGGKGDGDPVDGDADTDTDTDTDTDADADTEPTDSTTTPTAASGPMGPAWYRLYGAYRYSFRWVTPLRSDTGLPDTGLPDTGPRDTGGLPDTGPRDTGAPDTGPRDTGGSPGDTGPRDTGASGETGRIDTGVPDDTAGHTGGPDTGLHTGGGHTGGPIDTGGDADTDADADADTDTDTDTDADTGDTGLGSPFWRPDYVSFVVDFGWDGDGHLIEVDATGSGYGVYAPVLVVTFTTEAYYETETPPDTEWCTFEMPLLDATPVSLPPGSPYWFAATYSGAPIGGNCDTPGWDIDPALLGDLRATWEAAPTQTSFAIGGNVSPEVIEVGGLGDYREFLIGGRIDHPLLADPITDVYGFGFEMTADGVPTITDGLLTLVPTDDLFPWP